MFSHGQPHTGEAQTGHRLGRKDLQGTYGIKTSFLAYATVALAGDLLLVWSSFCLGAGGCGFVLVFMWIEYSRQGDHNPRDAVREDQERSKP